MLRSLSLLLLTACAPATLNLVQPGALRKTTLDGEWYWLDTVVDVPYGTGVAFAGLQSSLDRVRFEVEEDLLVGYRTYDHVGRSDPGEDAAAPVVAWRITSHFDIRRAYDPRTGEETNVIEENRERPWYAREFFRVDWSENVAAAGRMDLAGVPLVVSAIADTEPGDTAPQLDDSDGDGIIDHLRFPRRLLAQPDQVWYDGYGNVPTCLFFGRQSYDCAPSEIRVDSTFRRVDPTSDYVGSVQEDAWSSTFGVFTSERLHYDRRYGVTESERIRWANRHDLWDNEIARDEDGQILCDVGDKRRPCAEVGLDKAPTVALAKTADRTLKPIVYHVSNGFDPSLASTLPRIEAEWNAPLRDAVNGLRRWECLDAGKDEDVCDARVDPDLQAFILCPHNPSEPGDPAACNTDHTGPDGRPDGIPDVVLPGDLRYHLLRLIDQPQLDSPLGYGPSAADPVGDFVQTADGPMELGAGRIVAATANLYAFGIDALAARTLDLVRLLRGDLPEDAFISGQNVEAWAAAMRDEGSSVALVGGFGAPDDPITPTPQGPKGLTSSARARADLATMGGEQTAPVWADLARLGRPTDPATFKTWITQVQGVLDGAPGLAGPAPGGPGSWEAFEASPFDDAM